MTVRPVGGRIFGRDPEINAVAARLGALADGRPRTVLVHGEAGIGKSTLMAHAVRLAERELGDLRVVRLKANQMEANRPFGAIADAVDSSRDLAAEVAPIAAALAAQAPEFEVIERCAAVLEQLALRAPVVCVLDDLHWGDESSLRALAFASRHLTDLPVGIVASYRPVPSSPLLATWIDAARAGGALDLPLSPLDSEAAVALATEVAGATPGPRLASLIAGAAGNPFYVIELIEALAADRTLVTRGDTVDVETASLPPEFRSAIVRFLVAVSPSAVELLRTAAVLGTSFTVAELAAVTGHPAHHVVTVTEEGLRAGALGSADDRLTFRHDLLREALYADLPESARRALHLDVARALAAARAEPLRVAEHLLAGGPERDPQTVRWLLDAAQAAPDMAVRATLLRTTMGLLDAADDRRVEVAGEAVHALGASGRFADAEALVAEELAMNPSSEIAMRAALIRVYADHLMQTQVLAEIEQVIDHPDLPPALHAELLARAASAWQLTGRGREAEEAARRVLADDAAEPTARILANQTLFAIRAFSGRSREAMPFAEAAVRAESPLTPTASRLFLIMGLLAEDRLDDVDEAWRLGYTRARTMGYVPPQPVYLLFRSLRMLLAGRLDDSAADAEAALAVFADIGGAQGAVAARAVLARVALHHGDVGAARAWLDIGGPPPPEIGADWYLWALALTEEADGRPEAALASLGAGWDMLAPVRYHLGAHATLGPDLVRLALAQEDRARATGVAEVMPAGTTGSDAASNEGAALLCRGLVDRDPAALARAVAAYARGPRVLQTARAREDLADVSPAADAVSQLKQALATYDRTGANADAARVMARLRAHGVRVGARGRRARPSFGWESLTPTERRVVDLAVRGRTTREMADQLYISRNTVETHLKHIYRKVGVSSRLELAAAATQR